MNLNLGSKNSSTGAGRQPSQESRVQLYFEAVQD